MKQRLFAIIAIFLITGSACTTSSPSQVSFGGKVIRGQDFEKELGQKLFFRLVPFKGDGQGWEIWVGNKTQPEQNFSAYVTPPYRGPNGRYIEGWTFTRPELLGYQRIRRFDFVLNESAHQLASDELHKLMRPYKFSEAEVEQAWEIRDAIPTASGTLTITNMEIDNSVSSSFPLINLLEFEVNVNLSTNGEQ